MAVKENKKAQAEEAKVEDRNGGDSETVVETVEVTAQNPRLMKRSRNRTKKRIDAADGKDRDFTDSAEKNEPNADERS